MRPVTMKEALQLMKTEGIRPNLYRIRNTISKDIVLNYATSYYGHPDALKICSDPDLYNSYLCRNLSMETLKGIRDSTGRIRRNYTALSCLASMLKYQPSATFNDRALLNGITLVYASEFISDALRVCNNMISVQDLAAGSPNPTIYPFKFYFTKDGNEVICKKNPMMKHKIMAYLTAPTTHRCFIIGYTPTLLRHAVADELIHFTDKQKKAKANFLAQQDTIFIKYGTPQLEVAYAEWILNAGAPTHEFGTKILGGYAQGQFMAYKQGVTGAKPSTQCAFTDGIYDYCHNYFTKAIADFDRVCQAYDIPEQMANVYYAGPTFFGAKISPECVNLFTSWLRAYPFTEVGPIDANILLSAQLL